MGSYQLKNVAHAWYKIWQYTKALSGGLITLELFKTTFLDRFFPTEMREANVEEFINIKQGLMAVT